MFRILTCGVLLSAISVQGQTWNSRACLVGFSAYYSAVIQELFRQIENDVRWCNMKMDNRGHNIDEQLFKWHAKGTVNYTDGFVVSIDKIDVTDIKSSIGTSTINGTQITRATFNGVVNLRGLNVGFDVLANLEDSGAHRFTGTYSHTYVKYIMSITRNMNTNAMSAEASVNSVSGGISIRMIYRPANNITEMLSRSIPIRFVDVVIDNTDIGKDMYNVFQFSASDNWNSFSRWGRAILTPRLLKAAETIDFPTVRFDGKC